MPVLTRRMNKLVQRNVGRIVQSRQHDVDLAIAEKKRELRREARVQAAERKQEREERKHAEKNVAERFPRAVQGVLSLLELCRMPNIQQLIKLGEEHNRTIFDQDSGEYFGDAFSSFTFYHGSRRSGMIWDNPREDHSDDPECGTRDFRILFQETAIELFSGPLYMSEEDDQIQIPLQADKDACAKALESAGYSFDDDPSPGLGRVGLNCDQLKDEWDPNDLAAQVLEDCANPRLLSYYLKQALKGYSTAAAVRKLSHSEELGDDVT